MFVYIYRERERDRERERERDTYIYIYIHVYNKQTKRNEHRSSEAVETRALRQNKELSR